MVPLVKRENDCGEKEMGKQHECALQLIAGREASISPSQGTSLFKTQAGADSDGELRKAADSRKTRICHKRAAVVYPKARYQPGMPVERLHFPVLSRSS